LTGTGVNFCHAHREELQQPEFSAIDALEFPELHEESVGNLAFLRALFKLVRTAGVTDFGVKDLFKPEAPRLKKALSAVINFAKFREEKVQMYDELRDQSEASVGRRAQLEEEGRALRAELQRMQSDRAKEVPVAARIETEVKEAIAETHSLVREHDKARRKVSFLTFDASSRPAP